MEVEGMLCEFGRLDELICVRAVGTGYGRTLQIPQATVHSSLVAEAWFAWHSMPIVSRIHQRVIWREGRTSWRGAEGRAHISP